MSRSFVTLLCSVLLCSAGPLTLPAQVANNATETKSALAGAPAVGLCEVEKSPQKFNNKMIRIRALYETDFEASVISSPYCSEPFPATWVEFEAKWESRSRWSVRHGLSNIKWRVPKDVVFVGLFEAKGGYGHLDKYPFLFTVYRVDAVRDSGRFRPLPEQ
jgi:hypothetical protein